MEEITNKIQNLQQEIVEQNHLIEKMKIIIVKATEYELYYKNLKAKKYRNQGVQAGENSGRGSAFGGDNVAAKRIHS